MHVYCCSIRPLQSILICIRDRLFLYERHTFTSPPCVCVCACTRSPPPRGQRPHIGQRSTIILQRSVGTCLRSAHRRSYFAGRQTWAELTSLIIPPAVTEGHGDVINNALAAWPTPSCGVERWGEHRGRILDVASLRQAFQEEPKKCHEISGKSNNKEHCLPHEFARCRNRLANTLFLFLCIQARPTRKQPAKLSSANLHGFYYLRFFIILYLLSAANPV